MKKSVAILILGFMMALPVMASSTLIGFSYGSCTTNTSQDVSLKTIGVDVTYVGGETFGVYAEVLPFYAVGAHHPVLGSLHVTGKYFGVGSIIGVGGDLNFGSMGLILGGGVYSGYNHIIPPADASSQASLSRIDLGFGGSAKLYYSVNSRFAFNLGLTYAFSPWLYGFGAEVIPGVLKNVNASSFTISAGIGWRTGGRSSNSDADSSGDEW
ncbi:MAG: hypothetical protein MI717_05890 [Spirochaetales bacterium]|nr:hypothetical protein [Spirochaetales bacterium]